MLSDEELDRYARHVVLKEIGGAGQVRMKAARVAVIGAGGIGSPAIQYLAAAGIGRLDVIDDDRVDLSNLQRQTIFATHDSGEPKAQAAARRARAINPHCDVHAHVVRIDAHNVTALLQDADVILDGCDNFATRLRVADTALTLRRPLVSAAIGQFEGQLAVYRGWQASLPCYRCLVGSPQEVDGTCAADGVLGPMTGMVGSMAALEVLRAIVPFGIDPAGLLMVLDTLDWRFRTIRVPKDPGCPACGVTHMANVAEVD